MSDMRSFTDNIVREHNEDRRKAAERVVYRHLLRFALATSEVIVPEHYIKRTAEAVLHDLVLSGYITTYDKG